MASIFGVAVQPGFLANPCVAVNGYDGTCASGGRHRRGSTALALSPGGEQLYALAPGSGAVDVFTHGATGHTDREQLPEGRPAAGPVHGELAS